MLFTTSAEELMDGGKFEDLSNRIAKNREKLLRLSERYGAPKNNYNETLKIKETKDPQGHSNRSFEKILNHLEEVVLELSALHQLHPKGSANLNLSSSNENFSDEEISFQSEEQPLSPQDQSQNYWNSYQPSNFKSAPTSSTVSSNYWSVGYSRVTQDYEKHNWESNRLSFFGTSNINDYFTGYGSFYFGKGDYINQDLNYYNFDILNWEYGFSGGILGHIDLFSGNLKPFIGADIGYEYSFAKALASFNSNYLSFGWGFVWGINLGTEIRIGDSLIIVPQIRLQDVEPSTTYGLELTYFWSESWGTTAGFTLGSDYSSLDFSALFVY